MRQRGSFLLLASCLIFTPTTAGVLLSRKPAQPSPDVLAATRPLHETIEDLKSQLEKMEANHDTLEAATELFRLKAKAMKEELDVQKSWYDELMRAKIELEDRLENEVKPWKSQLADTEAMVVDTETEIVHQKHKLERLTEENKNLRSLLDERGQEMSAIKSENAQLREDLVLLKEQIQESMKKGMSSRLVYDINEFELGSMVVELADEYWDWLTGNASYLIEKISSLFDTTRQHSIIVIQRTREHLSIASVQVQKGHLFISAYIREKMGGYSHQSLRVMFTSLLQSVATAWDKFDPVASKVWQDMFVQLSSDLTNTHAAFLARILSKLAVTHKAMTAFLEWSLVTIANFHTTAAGGSDSHWLSRTCMYAKTHSSLIIILIDVALGLLLLEIALSAFHRCYKSLGRFVRKPNFGKRVLVSPKGPTPKASLLRTAGGLSLRSAKAESDSLSGSFVM